MAPLAALPPRDERLWVDVVQGDRTLQDAADATLGDDVLLIQSAFREVA